MLIFLQLSSFTISGIKKQQLTQTKQLEQDPRIINRYSLFYSSKATSLQLFICLHIGHIHSLLSEQHKGSTDGQSFPSLEASFYKHNKNSSGTCSKQMKDIYPKHNHCFQKYIHDILLTSYSERKPNGLNPKLQIFTLP